MQKKELFRMVPPIRQSYIIQVENKWKYQTTNCMNKNKKLEPAYVHEV